VTSDGGSFASMSVHIGTDWRVDCHTYDGHTPILSVDAGPVAVCYSIDARQATKAAVEFARALARDAQLFAAEVERLHAAQLPHAGDDNNDKAAGVNAA
jgi:hypothetical protein